MSDSKYLDRSGEYYMDPEKRDFDVMIRVDKCNGTEIGRFFCDITAPPDTDPVTLSELAVQEYRRVVESGEGEG